VDLVELREKDRMSALGHAPDPSHALSASGNLRRRQAVSRLFVGAAVTAAGMAITMLVILVYYVTKQGIGEISWGFLTGKLPGATGGPGGIGPALAGTAEMVMIATIIAVPVGVLTAIYLAEFASPRIGRVVRGAIDQMAGIPTIVTGLFVAGLITDHLGQSAIGAGIALSIVEVPLIARASLEAIGRVPATLREAADALGVAHWRTLLGVTLPTAAGGIVTATILAVARAAGETAPVLLTSSLYAQSYQLNPLHAVPSIPLEVLTLVNSGYSSAAKQAWGAAFLLIVVILAVNIGARVWLRRSERKRGL
jgi:phosphate transport system permease protein